ncbi:MAG: hypothetical protein R3350_06120 [Saprospiraceae bacterium]|nr:hypothetical protein [Saprospiraceae bacterium]
MILERDDREIFLTVLRWSSIVPSKWMTFWQNIESTSPEHIPMVPAHNNPCAEEKSLLYAGRSL